MAALVLDNIPSDINSYERLAVWAIQCLQSSANGVEVNVIQNEPGVPIAQAQLAVTADNTERFVLTAYVPCDMDELNSPDNKTWMAAQDISNAAPHENLLSN
jgi:hypothetical protein